MSKVDKPTPLKVYGRSHYACTKCKVSKIKCSGESPCSNCKNVNKAEECVYQKRDRKIVIMESDINKLHDRVKYLEDLVASSNAETTRLVSSGPIQERLNEKAKEFLFNDHGLENFLLSDEANDPTKWKYINNLKNKLPPKETALRLIGTVIDNYANEFFLIDTDTFFTKVDDIYALINGINTNDEVTVKRLNTKIKRQTLCYFCIVLAYGEQISNMPSNKGAIAGVEFYMMASELLNLTHEVVSMDFIMSATLLALYSANLNRYNTVYNYFGVAIRSAISQGYHRQPTKLEDTDLINQEKKKRLWWTIFTTDATWTARLNLPAQIDYTQTDVDLPTENYTDLGGTFDSEILEVNVHLAKYICKSVEKIYGAHMRTFSVNYINTDQFNQKILISNVIGCVNELTKDFEVPYLHQYKNCNIIERSGRKLVNLFLRFNLLVAIIAKPLVSLIFKLDQANLMVNLEKVESTVNKAITTSIANINILIKLYEIDRLFVIGFYDSQYLFTSALIIIMSSITDRQCVAIVNKAIALLKYMASKDNINAKNCMKKLKEVNEILSRTPEIDFTLNFDLNIQDIVSVNKNSQVDDHYYNPYEDFSFSSLSNFKLLKSGSSPNNKYQPKRDSTRIQGLNPNQAFQNQILNDRLQSVATEVERSDQSSYPQFTFQDTATNNRISNLSGASQTMLFNMMNELQSFDDSNI